ncbi:OsmC family protein [Pseudonocardia kujensis]|uniref:OsmC family protein n=1 Tax=Pseudonocardia kujensis TaxID=1128675 RepID=UPI001E4B83F6|nr:OsmC family protein [Pseudonocardia kujensis]MCE0766596.1 OsmC family protein [Pseudonocardia kujensis]
MARTHDYAVTVRWTGDEGSGTAGYRSYSRAHDVVAGGKPVLAGSADPAFLGDPARWNPEELLVAALAQCHMLSYLALCARQGVVVTGYSDAAEGTMEESATHGGHFTGVVLRPRVRVADEAMRHKAESLHHEAAETCFIANSVDFPVHHHPVVEVG